MEETIIHQMMHRKQTIMNNLKSLRNDFLRFDAQLDQSIPHPSAHSSPQQPTDTTECAQKETLLKQVDQLKIQNQLLLLKVQEKEVLLAENSILSSQLSACRSELSKRSLELSDSNIRNSDLELTIASLKNDLTTLRAKIQPVALDLPSKRMEISERLAMINQQQSLILEIEKIKSEYDKYRDLIASIETVASTGKVCLVSSRGLKVTTMLELAQEIKNFK